PFSTREPGGSRAPGPPGCAAWHSPGHGPRLCRRARDSTSAPAPSGRCSRWRVQRCPRSPVPPRSCCAPFPDRTLTGLGQIKATTRSPQSISPHPITAQRGTAVYALATLSRAHYHCVLKVPALQCLLNSLYVKASAREGAPLSWRPSADAVAGNGGPLNWPPSAHTVAGNGAPLSWRPSADAVAGRLDMPEITRTAAEVAAMLED